MRTPSLHIVTIFWFNMASNEQDAVLTCDHSDKSFSGFSLLSESEHELPCKESTTSSSKKTSTASGKKKDTPVEKVCKKKKTSSKMKNKSSDSGSSIVNDLDMSKLTQSDIMNLRTLLGIENPQLSDTDNLENQDIQELYGHSLSNPRGLTVSIDRDDISGGESPLREPDKVIKDMTNAVFGESDIDDVSEWELPRLKAPVKWKSVLKSLANLINIACTSQCDTDSLLGKYKIPDNCDKACAPLVNSEIWKVMDKRSQTLDRSLADIQNLVGSGMTPIIQLAEVLKPQIPGNNEAKTLLADSLTLLGQVQFDLSVRRRYLIRPTLKKKYHSLCNVSMPITTNLFGDEISKDIKTCDSLVAIGK